MWLLLLLSIIFFYFLGGMLVAWWVAKLQDGYPDLKEILVSAAIWPYILWICWQSSRRD